MMTWPSGFYRGRILSPWWLTWLGYAWTGKHFYQGYVLNRVFGLLVIRGIIAGAPDEFAIRYCSWMRDEVRSIGGAYAGTMTLGPVTVEFSLTKEGAP